MPNWCQNEWRVEGPPEEVARFLEEVRGEHRPLSFQRVLPMPAELEATFNTPPPPDDSDTDSHWYTWRLAHWGVKWDVDDPTTAFEWETAEGYAGLFFDTAWAPPEGIMQALRERYPALSFDGFYREDLAQIAGYL